jgi:hypothetical protein
VTKHRVETPEPGHSGLVGGIYFQDGVAVVDDTTHANALGYMRGAGYRVHEVAHEVAAPEVEPEPSALDGSDTAKPKKAAPVGEWRAYATTQGMSVEDADALTKNQLVERFADSEEENE